MKFLLDYNMKIVIVGLRELTFSGGKSLLKGLFLGGDARILAGGGLSSILSTKKSPETKVTNSLYSWAGL